MAKSPRIVLSPHAVIEDLGHEVMVVVPGQSSALKLSGPHAEAVRSLQAGRSVYVPTDVVVELADWGVVQQKATMSRRSLIRAGAVGAGAGVAALAMPSVAAASSPDSGDDNGDDSGPVFDGWQVTSVGWGTTSSADNALSVTVAAIDTNGQLNTVYREIPSGRSGTVTFQDNTTLAVQTADTDNIFRAEAPIASGVWRSSANVIEFEFDGETYNISFAPALT